MWITVIIPRNFFSFLQSKNYHKAFLKGFQKKRIVRHFKKFAPDQTEARRAEKIFLEVSNKFRFLYLEISQEKTICVKKLHLLSLFKTITAQKYTMGYLKHISAVKSALCSTELK